MKMKNIHNLNTIIYLIIIALYIYEPVYGALGQIGLGIFQLVLAIRLSMDIKEFKPLGRRVLKIYWYSVLFWFIGFWIIIFTPFYDDYGFLICLIIIPMIIGLYFTVVTFLIKKGLQ